MPAAFDNGRVYNNRDDSPRILEIVCPGDCEANLNINMSEKVETKRTANNAMNIIDFQDATLSMYVDAFHRATNLIKITDCTTGFSDLPFHYKIHGNNS
uniref:Uncharacterized protein n=1 Tax=Pristionchus pacificus TaxID=54126 RepID=A0A2A6C2R9_PRIPA|eukprot:PDM72398.1 hypothetical protein PRIPAC_38832 [Pristionchus pacificus]